MQSHIHIDSLQAEQSVIGALFCNNDALDSITDLQARHFSRKDHKIIFAEIVRQIGAGEIADIISVHEKVRGQVDDCLPYLNSIQQSIGSAANIVRYAEMVIDKSVKRALLALSGEIQDVVNSGLESSIVIDQMATKLDALAHRKSKQEPKKLSDTLSSYVETIQGRMDGTIKPIATGFRDLDAKLGGGADRGTLVVVAGRPGTGKTAMGLALARNAGELGTSLVLSMEMPEVQVNDRNVAALGKIPVYWLKKPDDKTDEDRACWDRMTHAFARAQALNMYIDDQTSLNLLEIRSKARQVKRKQGLDLLVIDQLSFITGSTEENKAYAIGDYTRGLVALAKELGIVVVLLCQLNRDCEKRPNKRPIMADLAISGSIEQDAAYILFLYRDELYNPETPDKGICEVNVAKQRQGEVGVVALQFFGNQTRFENTTYPWKPQQNELRSYKKSLRDGM